MTVQPVFQRVGHEWELAGSALQIGPQLLLTCDHVLCMDKHRRSKPLGVENLAIGAQYKGLSCIRRAEAKTLDLAILELREPAQCSRPVFSRQWKLEKVFGYGFAGPPFDRVQKDGPLPIDQRGSAFHIPLDHGMLEGYSGGPTVGLFRGEPYCIGLNQLGGIGRAASVLIPAPLCVDFVNGYYSGVCHIVDLSLRSLELFLVEQEAGLLDEHRKRPLRNVALVETGHAATTPTPLIDIAVINREALRAITLGEAARCIAVGVDAAKLGPVLKGGDCDGDPAETLIAFLRDHGFAKLQYEDALFEYIREGKSAVFLMGYDQARLGNLYPLVRAFLHRMAEQQLHVGRTNRNA